MYVCICTLVSVHDVGHVNTNGNQLLACFLFCIFLLHFLNERYRLANVAVGVITRESVRQALINGITADQVRY